MNTASPESTAASAPTPPRMGIVRRTFALFGITGWRGSPDMIVGGIFLLVHITLVLVGALITPYPYTEFHMSDTLKPPSLQYWFGTDHYGRDVFSRVVYGAHGTLLLSAAATALGVGLGVAIGMTVGYKGGRLDEIVMRIMDGLLSFPSLLLAMLIMSSLGPSKINVVIAIMIVFVPRSTRVLRSVTGLKTSSSSRRPRSGRVDVLRSRANSCPTPPAPSSSKSRSGCRSRSCSAPRWASSASACSRPSPTGG
ncbi:MAG: ABC transporter permease [Betaproteobacteria bacterium]|nr:ABC transporter permease [Betaproteobacteria bacterium]